MSEDNLEKPDKSDENEQALGGCLLVFVILAILIASCSGMFSGDSSPSPSRSNTSPTRTVTDGYSDCIEGMRAVYGELTGDMIDACLSQNSR